PRDAYARGHLHTLLNFATARIDTAQFALVTFPRGVPQLAIHPRHASDEAIGLDGAQNRTRFRIDLMDLAFAILTHPKTTLGPRQSRIAAAAGRRYGGEHFAGFRIDLLNAVLGDLKQMLAIEGGSRMRGDVNRARRLAADGIHRGQLVAGGDP